MQLANPSRPLHGGLARYRHAACNRSAGPGVKGGEAWESRITPNAHGPSRSPHGGASWSRDARRSFVHDGISSAGAELSEPTIRHSSRRRPTPAAVAAFLGRLIGAEL